MIADIGARYGVKPGAYRSASKKNIGATCGTFIWIGRDVATSIEQSIESI